MPPVVWEGCRMITVRVRDKTSDVLSFDLIDVLLSLGRAATNAFWEASGVAWKMSGVGSKEESLDATGTGADELEALATSGERISGTALLQIARDVRQVIWGEFRSYGSDVSEKPITIIRAIDSTFFEVATKDEAIMRRIRAAFADVRTV